MKVVHVCYSDLDGGAARAAYRLHRAQRRHGLDSHMLVVNKQSDDPYVHAVSKARTLRIKAANFIAAKILALQKTRNKVHHSLNLFPSGILAELNALEPDLVNLHWIGGEMISIGEVAKIKKPVVWTLHDMWAFCGAEHYDHPESPERYRRHYAPANRPVVDSGWDLDQFCHRRKAKAWKKLDITVVTPSRWLSSCVKESTLLGNSAGVVSIQNCVDHAVYRPLEKKLCRELLGLPQDKPLLLFGAMSSTSDPRKGYLFLKGALQRLASIRSVDLVIFGAGQGAVQSDTGVEAHYVGRVSDDVSLVALYNAADVFVAPSVQDNLPNTLVEALACGTPCVAFKIGGMAELIGADQSSGCLAEPFGEQGLAEAIESCLSSSWSRSKIALDSEKYRSEAAICSEYRDLYDRKVRGEKDD